MLLSCSGDQDSVVPLMGSRTLIRELAHDLKLKVTVPYSTWFYKGQVHSFLSSFSQALLGFTTNVDVASAPHPCDVLTTTA